MGAGYVLYVIVTPEGAPRKRASQGRTLMVYEDLDVAKRQCRIGDAVMRLPLDLGQEPVHIRARKQVNIEDDDGDA